LPLRERDDTLVREVFALGTESSRRDGLLFGGMSIDL
jgi:hypothetical protein